ncbi:PQQ-binding-like beta-propeller repeat protein, partial [Streptomyces sp. SID4931]|nr:PQQ-binding-like beta-propeller repeat protein [Streptomyces sp. SID4931]
HQGTVLVVAEQGVLHAVDSATGRKRWEFDGGPRMVTAPDAAAGRVYVCTTADSYALDAQTGRPVWSLKTPGASDPVLGGRHALPPRRGQSAVRPGQRYG